MQVKVTYFNLRYSLRPTKILRRCFPEENVATKKFSSIQKLICCIDKLGCRITFSGSRTIVSEENSLAILKLAPTQILTLTGGAIFLGGNFPDTHLTVFNNCHRENCVLLNSLQEFIEIEA